jgi:hypothetical protein
LSIDSRIEAFQTLKWNVCSVGKFTQRIAALYLYPFTVYLTGSAAGYRVILII